MKSGAVVVRLRGLPQRSTKDDVLAFLEGFGLGPERVHLLFNKRRTVGEALVVFDSLEQAHEACAKDKDFFSPKFGERYVRVSVAEDVAPDDLLSLDGATGSKVSRSKRTASNQKVGTVIKVDGLPAGITPPEVLQLFWGWQANVAGAYVQRSQEDELRAEAFVNFKLAQHAAQAVALRHGTAITTCAGLFQLTVQHASKAEWEAVVTAQQANDGIIKVKGLPIKATADDVLAFFQGCCIKPGGVHVQPISDNRHSKVAFVQFESAEEAARALDKDRQKFGDAFGDRYCLLQLVHKAEFEQEVLNFQQQMAGSSGIGSSSSTVTRGSLATAALGTAGATGSAASMPPCGGMGMGMVTSVPGTVTGSLPPGLPPLPSMMLPLGYALPQAMVPMPGVWPMPGPMPISPHMQPLLPPFGQPGVRVPPGMFPAAPTGPWPSHSAIQGPLPSALPAKSGNTAAARYMVQDLTTGQQVFLDPRFNLSSFGILPSSASFSAAATASIMTGTGPAVSQQTQLQAGTTAGASTFVDAGQQHDVPLVPQHHNHHHHNSHQQLRFSNDGSSGDGGNTHCGSGGGSNDGSDGGNGGGCRSSSGKECQESGSSHQGSDVNGAAGTAAAEADVRCVAGVPSHTAKHGQEHVSKANGSTFQQQQHHYFSHAHPRMPSSGLLTDGVEIPRVKRTRS